MLNWHVDKALFWWHCRHLKKFCSSTIWPVAGLPPTAFVSSCTHQSTMTLELLVSINVARVEPVKIVGNLLKLTRLTLFWQSSLQPAEYQWEVGPDQGRPGCLIQSVSIGYQRRTGLALCPGPKAVYDQTAESEPSSTTRFEIRLGPAWTCNTRAEDVHLFDH